LELFWEVEVRFVADLIEGDDGPKQMRHKGHRKKGKNSALTEGDEPQ